MNKKRDPGNIPEWTVCIEKENKQENISDHNICIRKRDDRGKMLLLAMILLILANLFNGSLSISSFEKLYLDSLMSNYRFVSSDLQRNIERSVRFGKPLAKLLGISAMLEELRRNSPDIHNISVADTDGKILYSLDPSFTGNRLPSELETDFSDADKKIRKRRYARKYASIEGNYHLVLPIRNPDKKWIGTIDACFQKNLIQSKIRKMIFWNLRVLGLTTLVASVLLSLAMIRFIDFQAITAHKKRLYLILFLLLGGAQIVYSFYNVGFFKGKYIDITREKSEKLTQLLKEDIEFLLKKGIRINRLIKIDVLMNEIIQAAPEIEDIQILNSKKTLLYLANRQRVSDIGKEGNTGHQVLELSQDPMFLITSPLAGKQGEQQGYLRVHISRAVIQERIREIILDSTTVVLISFIFITELMIFLFVLFRQKETLNTAGTDPAAAADAYSLIRPAAFICCFAIDLPVSFVPLHAEDLYVPLFGLSKEVIMGLPISVNMLFATFAFLIGGVWVDKRGWQSTHLWGVLCLAGGALLSGIADTAAEFILYRGLMGFGYGLTFMSYMGFVYGNTGEHNRTMGFATMSAGMFSGSICGGAVGGMLAERIGYSPVFFVVTALLALALVFPFLFMRHTFQKLGTSAHQTGAKVSVRMIFQFLSNRNIFSLLMFLSIPSAITFVGFLYYVSPIYLDRLGTSQANIARILMINGIAMIYLSPMISPMIDRSASKKTFIIISGILGASGLLLFYFLDGLPAIICVIAMLSLSACFGNSSRTVFALQQEAARELGGGQAMSLYRTIDRIGWVLGPMMLGLVIASGNIRMGLTLVGLIYLMFTLLFVLVTREGGLRGNHQSH